MYIFTSFIYTIIHIFKIKLRATYDDYSPYTRHKVDLIPHDQHNYKSTYIYIYMCTILCIKNKHDIDTILLCYKCYVHCYY